MKQTVTLIFSFIALLTISAFTTQQSTTYDDADPGVYKIMEVAYLWDLLKEGYEPNRETDGTWLTTGVRSKYAMARKYASIELLETAYGTKVFLRGPHNDDLDLNSTTSFGYYNPDFIAKVTTSVEQVLSNPVYKKAASYVYQTHLKSMVQTYMEAYRYVNRDQTTLHKYKSQYIMDLAQPEGTMEGAFQETFRPFAEQLERDKGADIYEAFTAPPFWLRRSIDGTGPSIFRLIEMVDSALK